MTTEIRRKSTKEDPVLKHHQKKILSVRDSLRQTINKHFDGMFWVFEACLSVKAQMLIDDISLPFCLILVGNPSTNKSTVLDIIGSLPDCYKSDSFTPKAFVSHAANKSKDELKRIDLLPKIRFKTLITSEMGTVFSVREENLIEVFGILTRLLDGRGFRRDSGSQGSHGYSGNYYFTWLGAVVEIQPKVWRVMGNLGSKMYFLRITSEIEDQQEVIAKMKKLLNESHSLKIQECSKKIREFWDCLSEWKNQFNDKIVWDSKSNDESTITNIAMLAQLVAKLRAVIPTIDTENTSGSNYGYGIPIEENPNRAFQLLCNLAKGHAISCGRNFINSEDLSVVVWVALSSAPKERTKLLKLLKNNFGKLNTLEVQDKLNVTKSTAQKYMKQFEILGFVKSSKDVGVSKPINGIELKDQFKWLLKPEFDFEF